MKCVKLGPLFAKNKAHFARAEQLCSRHANDSHIPNYWFVCQLVNQYYYYCYYYYFFTLCKYNPEGV